jgi:hypothetical protein
LCADLVRIRFDPFPNSEAMPANLEDISASGACLHLDCGVAPGEALEIICSKTRLRGRVRYCRFVEAGWDIGVEFETRNAWNLGVFRPAHLLDVEVWGNRSPRIRSTLGTTLHFGGDASRS